MRATSIIAILGLTACGSPSVPEIPWLYGLSDAVATEDGRRELAERLPPGEDDCAIGAQLGMQLVADVVGSQAQETVVASFSRGLAVLDREGQLIAQAAGYPCTGGSADALDALAVGRAYGVPTIVLAATEGGRNISHTWLGLYRVGSGRLDAVFTAIVEERGPEGVRQGAIYLLPNALLYKRPGGPAGLWTYDDAAGAYLFEGVEGREDDGGGEPPHVPVLGAR